jgi:hypothetical protein
LPRTNTLAYLSLVLLIKIFCAIGTLGFPFVPAKYFMAERAINFWPNSFNRLAAKDQCYKPFLFVVAATDE